MSGVGVGVYNDFNARLIYTLYTQASIAIKYDQKLYATSKRLKKEKNIQKEEAFKKLPRSLQRNILSIPSDLLFIKYPSAKIIDISIKSSNLEDYIFHIDNSKFLTIEIIRKDNLDLSYLLNKLRKLDIVNMDICKLFKSIKYFNIEFSNKIDNDELIIVEKIIYDALNSTHQLKLPRPDIKESEVEIDCNHSQEHAMMRIKCKDQKGILCYTIDIFDRLNIDITSAKIHTQGKKVNDLFLIEKNGNFCNNTKLIIKELTE